MTLEITAVYEGGVLRPDAPLPFAERQRVSVTVRDGSAAASGPALPPDEFDLELHALSADLQLVSLPEDFSRAQLYGDHD